jgi:hypothetical protein
LYREQRALHVEIEEPVEMLLREACQGSELADARIGDQDIDLSLRLYDLVEAIEVLQVRDVPERLRRYCQSPSRPRRASFGGGPL